MPGAAEVPFLATRHVEFSSRPSPQAVVWLELVPTARRKALMKLSEMPVSSLTPETHGGNFAPRGISDRPTARARAEGKPEQYTPRDRRAGRGGELALDKRHSGYTVQDSAPLEPRPSAMREGRVAESGAMPER